VSECACVHERERPVSIILRVVCLNSCSAGTHVKKGTVIIKYYFFQIVPVKTIKDEFPFHRFFDNAPKPLFKCQRYEEDMQIAEGCFR
jgi:hypothetical protein